MHAPGDEGGSMRSSAIGFSKQSRGGGHGHSTGGVQPTHMTQALVRYSCRAVTCRPAALPTLLYSTSLGRQAWGWG